MVIANPMQVTSVKAVPFNSGIAFCATSVEKSGESAITTKPQKMRKATNRAVGRININGDSRQHIPERLKAIVAIFCPKRVG